MYPDKHHSMSVQQCWQKLTSTPKGEPRDRRLSSTLGFASLYTLPPFTNSRRLLYCTCSYAERTAFMGFRTPPPLRLKIMDENRFIPLKSLCHENFEKIRNGPIGILRSLGELIHKTNLPSVSLTPIANLPPVSLIPVAHLDLQISPRIFEKIRKKDPIFQELGGI